MMVPSRWIIEIAVSLSSASDATKSSKWEGSTPRTAMPIISPWRPVTFRAKTVVQTLVTLLTTGSTMTSGVGLPDMNSWK